MVFGISGLFGSSCTLHLLGNNFSVYKPNIECSLPFYSKVYIWIYRLSWDRSNVAIEYIFFANIIFNIQCLSSRSNKNEYILDILCCKTKDETRWIIAIYKCIGLLFVLLWFFLTWKDWDHVACTQFPLIDYW